MAKPRAFISSTFYDLRQVREDVGVFLRTLGFDAVLFEDGHVPYGNLEALEEYCYKEIESCDILISIVGRRFGSESSDFGYSISQKELREALLQGKQTYIFVEHSVYQEFGTYKKNRNNKQITYNSVDDTRIFEFLEELEQLPRNKPIFSFTSAKDISNILSAQLMGLFQRLLREQNEKSKLLMSQELQRAQLSVQEDLHPFYHPAFERVQVLLRIPFRVVFSTVEELHELLRQYQFTRMKPLPWENDFEWTKIQNGTQWYFRISKTLFDAGENIKPVPMNLWEDNLITLDREELESRE